MEFEPIFITYGAILAMAHLPIYFGSYMSIAPSSTEQLGSKDAYMFPLYASCALFGLYLVFKLVPEEYLNMLMQAYFVAIATVAVANAVRPIVKSVHPIVAGLIGVAVAAGYGWTKHWCFNNIIGLCFSITGIEFMALGGFKTGAILLSGLFFYDIFWVFGTEVMVTVAKKFDAPIKVLFPKDIFAEEFQFSMLGLGDIVIPGIFIALMLRFDHSRKAEGATTFSTPYFKTCFVAYFLGLVTCIGIMHHFQAAQPALLYLVPYCLGAVMLLAVCRGEFGLLWNYEEKSVEKEEELPWREQLSKLWHNVFLGKPEEPKKKAEKKED